MATDATGVPRRAVVVGHHAAPTQLPPGALPAPTGSPAAPSHLPPVSAGDDLLDQLLGGGLPRGTATMLLGSPYAGKELAAAQFAAASAASGEPLAVCLTAFTPQHFRELVASVGPGLEAHEAAGRVAYVDCFAGILGEEPGDPHAVAAPRPEEQGSLLQAFQAARRRLGDPPELNAVFLGLTDLALHAGPAEADAGHPWLQRILAHLRRWGATSVLTIEAGLHREADLGLFRHFTDGAVEFEERSDARTFLRVRGHPALTRDWVEYVANGRVRIIGSFTEHKIR